VWTLADADSMEWTLEHEATFTEIWADESYKATGLPREIPTLALIHPKNPDVVYFFLEEHLFGVDVRAHKVVECEVYGLVAPPSCQIASRFVRAWELPRALSSGNDTIIPFPCFYYVCFLLFDSCAECPIVSCLNCFSVQLPYVCDAEKGYCFIDIMHSSCLWSFMIIS
jgi:hypothetical protein